MFFTDRDEPYAWEARETRAILQEDLSSTKVRTSFVCLLTREAARDDPGGRHRRSRLESRGRPMVDARRVGMIA